MKVYAEFSTDGATPALGTDGRVRLDARQRFGGMRQKGAARAQGYCLMPVHKFTHYRIVAIHDNGLTTKRDFIPL